MTQVTLPNLSVTGANLWSQVEDNDKAIRDVVNGNIDATNLASDAVTTAKIANDAVTSAKIAADAVGSSEIAADAVGSSEIAADAVGSSEIAADAVGSSEIAAAAVGTSELADGSVTTGKLAANAVTTAKVETGILPPSGAILQYAGASAPTGWLLCDGTAISRTTYADLFATVGTAYGTGDGSTTFNLPDLRGRVPVGLGTHSSVDALGDNDGTSVANRRPAHSHTGTTDSGGAHTHTVGTTSNNTGSSSPTRVVGSASSVGTSTVTTGSDGAHTHTVTLGSTGGTTDAPSFVVVNFIIKT